MHDIRVVRRELFPYKQTRTSQTVTLCAVSPNSDTRCQFCQSEEFHQCGPPEGPTELTWYECESCGQLWFHETDKRDEHPCAACKRLGVSGPLTPDSVVITLRCTSCGREWFFPI